MIGIELNEPTFKMTNDQMHTIVGIITENGWHRNYDVVDEGAQSDAGQVVSLWVHPDDGATGHPIRHHIIEDGRIILSEDVDWWPHD